MTPVLQLSQRYGSTCLRRHRQWEQHYQTTPKCIAAVLPLQMVNGVAKMSAISRASPSVLSPSGKFVARMEAALTRLSTIDPTGEWASFLLPEPDLYGNRVRWNNTVVSGHSRGSALASAAGVVERRRFWLIHKNNEGRCSRLGCTSRVS